MQSEFDSHMKTGTFHMVDRVPKGRNPVSQGSETCKLKMVFRVRDGQRRENNRVQPTDTWCRLHPIIIPLSFFSFYQVGSIRSKRERTPTRLL